MMSWSGLFGATGGVLLCLHTHGYVHFGESPEEHCQDVEACDGDHVSNSPACEALAVDAEVHCVDMFLAANDTEAVQASANPSLPIPDIHYLSGESYFTCELPTGCPHQLSPPGRAPPYAEHAAVQTVRTTVL